MALFVPGVALLGTIATVAVLLYGGIRVLDGAMQVGVLDVVPALPAAVLRPDAGHRGVLQLVPVGQRRAGEAVRRARGAPERARAGAPDAAAATARGDVDVRRRSRSATGDAVVLPHLDLHIPAGQTVALVGATGAGKTTIARLLARFYDPIDGQVLLDGVDLRRLSEARPAPRRWCMVTQENFLFSGSVADNIAFGRPGASRAEVERGRAGDRRARVHRGAARRLRHRRPQARRPAVRRAAPAGRVRPGVPGRSRRADPRRGDLVAGRAERAGGAAGAADAPGRAHRADHRPPAVHGGDRRPGAGPGATAGSSRTGPRPT